MAVIEAAVLAVEAFLVLILSVRPEFIRGVMPPVPEAIYELCVVMVTRPSYLTEEPQVQIQQPFTASSRLFERKQVQGRVKSHIPALAESWTWTDPPVDQEEGSCEETQSLT